MNHDQTANPLLNLSQMLSEKLQVLFGVFGAVVLHSEDIHHQRQILAEGLQIAVEAFDSPVKEVDFLLIFFDVFF